MTISTISSTATLIHARQRQNATWCGLLPNAATPHDLATRALIDSADLPPHMEAIIVPACPPQTKPKALNYALQFARGDLVTVFDAEDRPDPDQLRLAAETFAAAPEHCACLQAKLPRFEKRWG
jgi:glycosyltransferase XagB